MEGRGAGVGESRRVRGLCGAGGGEKEVENMGSWTKVLLGLEFGRRPFVDVFRPPLFWSWRNAASVLVLEGERSDESTSGGRPAWNCAEGEGSPLIDGVVDAEGIVVNRDASPRWFEELVVEVDVEELVLKFPKRLGPLLDPEWTIVGREYLEPACDHRTISFLFSSVEHPPKKNRTNH